MSTNRLQDLENHLAASYALDEMPEWAQARARQCQSELESYVKVVGAVGKIAIVILATKYVHEGIERIEARQ